MRTEEELVELARDLFQTVHGDGHFDDSVLQRQAWIEIARALDEHTVVKRRFTEYARELHDLVHERLGNTGRRFDSDASPGSAIRTFWQEVAWVFAERLSSCEEHADCRQLVSLGQACAARTIDTLRRRVAELELEVAQARSSSSGSRHTTRALALCPRCGSARIIDASQSLDCNDCGHSW